jgi:predicted DNA binding protein
MPLTWARATDPEALRDALDEDPSVENVSLLAEFDEERLYRMNWIDRVQLIIQMITNSQATVLEAYGADGEWTLRVMYPTRDALSATHEFCDSHGVTFDVERIRELEGEPAGRYGLTQEQYEALRAAHDAGYFEVPRRSNLDGLADDLGISHQALSERIRRGEDALLEATLLVGSTPWRRD